MQQKHVLVLLGGKSTEREVSLRSGAAVADALREAGFRVTEFDPAKEELSRIKDLQPDCAFIALHGLGGEDGAIQGLLEWMGIPFTGPGVASSALCMDKILTKKVLAESGVPTADFVEIGNEGKRDPKKSAEDAMNKLGLPLIFKACRQGSSIGTVIVRKKEEAAAALASLFSFGDNILAEKFLSGVELTVPIMGNEKLQVLPVIRITSEGEYYDYHSKYTPGQSHHIIPADISPELEKKVRGIATKAYLATGCRGLARVDLMTDEKGEPFVIELNTSPGMTATSLFPDAARAAGISFPELVTKLVSLAME